MATKRKTKTKAEKANKKVRFQQKRNQQANFMNNMQQAYQQQMMEKQDVVRRATIVEGILNARPEVAVEIDGKLTLNNETVYLNEEDGVLYWKNDNNPIMAGLDAYDAFSKYTPEFVNEVLEFISIHKAKQATQLTTDVDLGDFDLVEDEDFTLEEAVPRPDDN